MNRFSSQGGSDYSRKLLAMSARALGGITSRSAVIAVVMGVSGAGKSAIGEALACKLGWRFLDADDYHPPANIARWRRERHG